MSSQLAKCVFKVHAFTVRSLQVKSRKQKSSAYVIAQQV